MDNHNESYKKSGVDIEAGYEAVKLMKKHIAKTTIPGVLSDIGGFGGMFSLDTEGMEEPILVSGTDGVGTKLKLAFLLDKHDTIGIDCVAMCVNDIICSGAKPLFFLDYIATGKNVPTKIEQIVSGVAEGCVQSKCALVGGETAEMPGFYNDDEYDMAGFAVGIVDKKKVLNPLNVATGDKIVAIASSGVHSNGFSLVRNVFDLEKIALDEPVEELMMEGLLSTLLTPTKIYVDAVMTLIELVNVKSISHITGGGLYENLPRSLRDGQTAKIYRDKIDVLPIFDYIAKVGNIPETDMFNTFNMGIGMCVMVSQEDADKTVSILEELGEKAYIVGEVIDGDEGVIIC